MKIKGLLTGASGFLGSAILSYANDIDFKTLGRRRIDHIVNDLSKDIPLINESFDIIIHAAGKAHSVPKTEDEKKEFYDVNVLGTKHLLQAISNSNLFPSTFIYISSVAVYGADNGIGISEDTPLNAIDPYGKSKIEAEKNVLEWCNTNNVCCCILRLPLLVGPNPPGNLGAMINGIKRGYYFNIAGGTARKSMVLVKDVAELVRNLVNVQGVFNLTDGQHPTFAELSLIISEQLSRRQPLNLPYYFVNFLAYFGDIIGAKSPINTLKLKKITSDLVFDDLKARNLLKWNPRQVLKEFKVS